MSEQFVYYIGDEHCHFKYACGRPSVSGREFHDYDELVLFMGGSSRLISKGIRRELRRGELILIPQEQFHQFVIESPESYLRCIVGFRRTPQSRALIEEVMERVEVLEAPPKGVLDLLGAMMEISASNLSEAEKRAFLKNLPLQLLLSLKLASGCKRSATIASSSPIEEAMSYIDRHLAEPLTVERIACALHMSPSSLAHRFRAELNISVYRYVTEKRFSAVRQRVAQGERLAEAAEACGFRDYSGFFRLYKKYYGTSPSRATGDSFLQ